MMSKSAICLKLELLLRRLEESRSTSIGFPGASDFDYRDLMPFFGYELNNIGDPDVDPIFGHHVKDIEREVVDFVSELFRAPRDDRWGYVTTGGTEGNLYSLYTARSIHPTALVYRSAATHYSVQKVLDILGLQSITVRATDRGEMDYDDLSRTIGQHRERPAIVFANIGTTMTEAIDDVRSIKAVLSDLAMQDHYIHSDAALAGIPLALLEDRPGFDLEDGADSVSISGHKFIGSPFPCGVVITRRSLKNRTRRSVSYTGSPDTTVTGSRSGHAALLLWYAFQRHGVQGLHRRAVQARELAGYACDQLQSIGWEAWRHPYSFTVVLRSPTQEVAKRWALATSDGWSHLICMPGVSHHQIDDFIADVRSASNETSRPPRER